MTAIRLLVAATIILGSFVTGAVAQTVDDEGLGYPGFVDLEYPEVALRTRTQGVVVVALSLNGRGDVGEVTALSGPRLLVPTVVENARRWRFQPNPQNRAILAYEFRIQGACKTRSMLFSRLHRNFARVVACLPDDAPVEQVTPIATAEQASAIVFDEGVSRVSFEEMRYPTLARAANVYGLVVVRASLDTAGNVTQATALSGHRILTAEATANARLWTFKPGSGDHVIIVYNFELEGSCLAPQTVFRLLHVNLASVISCNLPVQTSVP